MQIGRLVLALSLLAVLSSDARASGPRLVIVQPAERYLVFDHTPYDQPSATQRVLVRNDGDPVGFEYISVGPPFEIVATGGGLGTGQVKFWDIACRPYVQDGAANYNQMEIDVCGSSCEDEWIEFLSMQCVPGLLDGPETSSFMFAYAYTSVQDTVAFTNPGPDPLTVTGFAASSMFSAAAASNTLPVTLAAGDHIDVVITFSPTGSGDLFGTADVLAGGAIAGRATILAATISQIGLPVSSLGIPLGARYSMPITVRNSYPSARTIGEVTSDLPGDVVTGLAGIELAPGESAHGLVSFAADELVRQIHTLAVDFDRGQGDVRSFGSDVVPATYAVSTGDAAPSDGLLDFGLREASAAPVEQTLTISNLTGTDEPIAGCYVPSAPFELVGACPTVLPANGSVQLTVRVVPTAPGLFADSLSLNVPTLSFITALMSVQVVASQPPPDGGTDDAGTPGPDDAGAPSPGDAGVPGAGDIPDGGAASGPGHGGGCRVGSGESGLAIALLALRRRRRPRESAIKRGDTCHPAT